MANSGIPYYGKFTLNEGKDVYEGQIIDGKLNGEGKATCYITRDSNGGDIQEIVGVFEGTFANNKLNGRGKITYTDGTYYVGNFINDKLNGLGKCFIDNVIYEGEFFRGKLEGKGKVILPNGDVREGFFSQDYLIEGSITKNGQILFTLVHLSTTY